MPLHLQKLSVGSESFEDLAEWVEGEVGLCRKRGEEEVYIHTTRMMPSRVEEILAGGSMFWIIRGVMCCRQRVLDLRPVTGRDGISRCDIVLEPELIRTEPHPHRAFQGWRYLAAKDAPNDLRDMTEGTGLPTHLVLELKELGLL